MIMSVDVEIGAGNAGAVGIHLRGAQGSSLEDVTVIAGDGAIGIRGLAGSGGAHSNLTVIGGRFGIDGRVGQPAPTLSGIVISNASCAGIVFCGAQTLTLVGAYFSLQWGVPAIVAGNPLPVSFPNSTGDGSCLLPPFPSESGPSTGALDGHVVVIDALFNFTGAAGPSANTSAPPISVSSSLVLRNAWFVNGGAVDGTVVAVAGPPQRAFGCSAQRCSLAVALLASGGDALPPVVKLGVPYTFRDPIYLDGQRSPNATLSNVTAVPPGEPLPGVPAAAALLGAHLYSARTFPTFEWLRPGSSGAAVCAWDASVAGDGFTDDAVALQAAIDATAAAGAALVLPRGVYATSVGIVMPPGAALVGIARTQSAVVAAFSGLSRGSQSDPAFAPAVLYAAPSPAAAPRPASAPAGQTALGSVVAFLSLLTWDHVDSMTAAVLAAPGADAAGGAIRNVWRQVLNSRLGSDQATFAQGSYPPPAAVTTQRPAVVLGGSSGASGWHVQVFFNDLGGAPAKNQPVALQGAGYRHLLLANATSCAFYQLNVEHAFSDAEAEAVGAGSIDVFSLKTELNAVALWARSCNGLRVWGHGGNGAALPFNTTERLSYGPAYADSLPSLYRLEACTGCLLANLYDQGTSAGEPPDVWHL